MTEMRLCQQMGVVPKRLIYSNPCKMERDLAFAEASGIGLTVFDSITELEKIRAIYPSVHLLLRINVVDNDAQVQFSHRFGAVREEWETMLRHAKNLGFEVRGISFHVGSGVSGGRQTVFKR